MILLDTNVLVAIVDPRDGLRRRVIGDLQILRNQKLLLTWPVLLETIQLLSSPLQREKLHDILSELDVRLAEDEQQPDLHAIFDWLEQYEDHSPDFADAYLVILCSMNRRWKVWTYDREFRTIWRRLDGSGVPMAVKT